MIEYPRWIYRKGKDGKPEKMLVQDESKLPEGDWADSPAKVAGAAPKKKGAKNAGK